jgi:hypothetical protein
MAVFCVGRDLGIAPQSPKGAALPSAAGAGPCVVIDAAEIIGTVQGRVAAGHRAVFVVSIAAFFHAVGEAIQEQEVND